ncbi:MAG: hypothetical protein NFCOHLIN_00383 [Gammaproteobacteria bacterium]|nr:hypothetical protein [Gammaproteobacteria bacterium]
MTQKYGFGSLTLLLWVVYLYLWIPFISVMAWLTGVHLFRHHIIERGGLRQLAIDLRQYGIVIGVMVAVYLGWAVTNYLRFRRTRRLGSAPEVTGTMLAAHFRVDLAAVEQLQSLRICEMSHDEDGNIVAMRPVVLRGRPRPAGAAHRWPRRRGAAPNLTRGPGPGSSASYARWRQGIGR